MTLVEQHKKICDNLNKIYEKKNHDYGNSFGETYKDLGIISAVTRISDKFNRLKTLAKGTALFNIYFSESFFTVSITFG